MLYIQVGAANYTRNTLVLAHLSLALVIKGLYFGEGCLVLVVQDFPMEEIKAKLPWLPTLLSQD